MMPIKKDVFDSGALEDDGEGVASPGEIEVILKPKFSSFSVLSMASLLMATWEASSFSFSSGLVGGCPVSLVYGYIISMIGALATAASLGELVSMYPSVGGQYNFVAKLIPGRGRLFSAWLTGWICTFAWITLVGSAPFLCASKIQGLIVLNYPTYNFQQWHGTLMYYLLILIGAIFNIWGISVMGLIQNFCLVLHVVAFIANVAVMWICAPSKHDASFVFGHFENSSGWSSSGVAWCIGMLSSCYVLTGYDGAIHLAEEIPNPRVNVPNCMLGSILLNGVLGFAFLLTLLFCMGDMTAALNSKTGFPLIEILYYVTGSKGGATAMTATIAIFAGIAAIPLIAASSRMVWALARDDALPYSNFLSHVNEKTQVPDRAVILTTFILLLLGLLNIASTTAFNAIVSLAVFGLQVSYGIPIALLLWIRLRRKENLVFGPWHIGRFSIATNIVSLVFLVFTSIFLIFPPYQPVTPSNMNYASLVFGAVVIVSILYWMFSGRKNYQGPSRGHMSGIELNWC